MKDNHKAHMLVYGILSKKYPNQITMIVGYPGISIYVDPLDKQKENEIRKILSQETKLMGWNISIYPGKAEAQEQ